MMGYQEAPQSKLFYMGINLDRKVRKNHSLRKINEAIDLVPMGSKSFEALKKVNEYGAEYWRQRFVKRLFRILIRFARFAIPLLIPTSIILCIP